jgi:hypothetical protein
MVVLQKLRKDRKNMKEETQVSIMIVDGCIELELDGFEGKIGLDERGLPLFTKSIKQQLPPYMPELLEKMTQKMRSDEASYAWVYLDVEHEDSCDQQFTDIEICNCNAVIRDHKIEEYVIGESWTLTCTVCNESSTGKMGGTCSDETSITLPLYEGGGKVRDFWRFDYYYSGRLICEDCFNKHIANSKAQTTEKDRIRAIDVTDE